MNKILRLVVALPGIFFVVTGLRWVVSPTSVAAEFGMPVLEGVGLSTQIGDLGSFFVACGLFVLIGLVTQKRSWFYASAMLLCFTALFRVLAWLLHGASFTADMIIVEIAISCLLLFAASRLPSQR